MSGEREPRARWGWRWTVQRRRKRLRSGFSGRSTGWKSRVDKRKRDYAAKKMHPFEPKAPDAMERSEVLSMLKRHGVELEEV